MTPNIKIYTAPNGWRIEQGAYIEGSSGAIYRNPSNLAIPSHFIIYNDKNTFVATYPQDTYSLDDMKQICNPKHT
jgi:hypothetical protein